MSFFFLALSFFFSSFPSQTSPFILPFRNHHITQQSSHHPPLPLRSEGNEHLKEQSFSQRFLFFYRRYLFCVNKRLHKLGLIFNVWRLRFRWMGLEEERLDGLRMIYSNCFQKFLLFIGERESQKGVSAKGHVIVSFKAWEFLWNFFLKFTPTFFHTLPSQFSDKKTHSVHCFLL